MIRRWWRRLWISFLCMGIAVLVVIAMPCWDHDTEITNGTNGTAAFRVYLNKGRATENLVWSGDVAARETVKISGVVFVDLNDVTIEADVNDGASGVVTFDYLDDILPYYHPIPIRHFFRLDSDGFKPKSKLNLILSDLDFSGRDENAWDIISMYLSTIHVWLSCADLSPSDAVRRYPPEAAAVSSGG